MSNTKILDVSNENWQQEVVQSEIPVLVDFWAEWCGPCKAIGPVLEELVNELNGKIKIVKVNVDSNHELAQKFEIRSIPTLLIFKTGIVQEQIVGGASKASLNAKLNEYL